MSTFKGVAVEFPDIRIDFFRPQLGTRPPLACFLSHVHSDHLAGLDTLKAPFVYCSPVTKEILLRLEKYPHRMNFALGILESRKQTYRHLEKLLKPIPLETPTKIELEPGNTITVTLFDANHCPGAVMFLIENDDKSILYTGDIRSEPSFITKLCQSPYLIQYTTQLRTLDCLYLDTSNLGSDMLFPSQADGLGELLQKVTKYPKDTIFHISAWTYGYEKVWMALSRMLNCQVHVDRYKMRIYNSIVGHTRDKGPSAGPFISAEGPSLAGYLCGNTYQTGCLTENPASRLHSCEKRLHCPALENNENVVWIKPIIARRPDGTEIAEIGIGGGIGDLKRHPELELISEDDVDAFLQLLSVGISDRDEKDALRLRLINAVRSSRLTTSLDELGILELTDLDSEISIKGLADHLTKLASAKRKNEVTQVDDSTTNSLPRIITFPFSRHSSYPELCDLVNIFQPKDIYPCTVDEETWHEGLSMENQFGKYCSGSVYRHDLEMRQQIAMQYVHADYQQTNTTQSTTNSEASDDEQPAQVSGNHPKCLDGSNSPRRTTECDQQASVAGGIITKSPGSQSQNLRRGLIVMDLEDRASKRICLPSADVERWPYDREIQDANVIPLASPIVAYYHGMQQESQARSLVTVRNDSAASNGEARNSLIDQPTMMPRCRHCEGEYWSANEEFCGACTTGSAQTPPYYEVITSDDGVHGCFGVAPDDITDTIANNEMRRNYVGDYLDVDSSAYDTQDEEVNFHEDYEKNSFIDDSSIVSALDQAGEDLDGVGEQDEPTSWRIKFKVLQSKHAALASEHSVLQQQQEVTLGTLEEIQNLYYDLLDEMDLRTGEEESEADDNGVIMVTPSAPSVLVTELILTSSVPKTREVIITNGDNGDRIEPQITLAEESNRVWQDASLMSAGNNHTEEEIEL